MLDNPKRHMIYQSNESIKRIESVPFNNRARDFLARTIEPEVNMASDIAKLTVHDQKLKDRLNNNRVKVMKRASALETLAAEREEVLSRPRNVAQRVGGRINTRKKA